MENKISGKILVRKKSGPGEITGITELDLYNNNVTFRELQFTEPGNYIITISSSNNTIDPVDINISVIKEDIISQDNSKESNINNNNKLVDGSRPIICQIDRPTIKIPEISIKQDGTGNNGQSDYTEGLGLTPFIWYKRMSISDRDIKSLSLYHDGIIPKIRFSFMDPNGIMKNQGTPQDNTTMDLFLNSTSSNLKSIHFKFKIEEFIQGKPTNGQIHTIVGTIDIPNLYVLNNNSYNGTSYESLRTICKELGMGFNSNISNTNDNMSWKNPNKKPYEFIEDIIDHSYISDESFMVGYIDFYYCFNYVDVEKELNRDISNDIGLNTSGISQQSGVENERLMKLSLTNDKSQSSSSNYIESFKIRNDSMKKSLKEGYLTINKSYDRINKQFLIFNVDSTTSDGNENIILKGGSDENFYKNNIKTVFTGKLDSDNTHKNYNYAKTQNKINIVNLNKVCINAKLPNANFNLYKFQKIHVDIINDTTTPTETKDINYRYSGEYIIADIEYIWSGGKMRQDIRLVKKELGKVPEEIKNDPPIKKRIEDKKINYNPSDPLQPNNSYNVGDTYLVLDNNNKLFELTVERIDENGYEITASIKEYIKK